MEPEIIELRLDTTKVASGMGGLTTLGESLVMIRTRILEVNKAIAGADAALRGQPFREILNQIKNAQKASSDALKVPSLARQFGIEQKALEDYITRYKDSIKGFTQYTNQFNTARTAALSVSRFQRDRADALKGGVGLASLLGGGGVTISGSVGVPASAVKASVEGQIPLIIPSSQIIATVQGQITAQGGVGGGGSGGSPREKKEKAATKASMEARGESDNELKRIRTETADMLRETITEIDPGGDVIATTYDSILGEIRKSVTTNTAKDLVAKLRNARAKAVKGFRAEKILAGNDPAALAKLQESQAAHLGGLLTPEVRTALGDKGLAHVTASIEGDVSILTAQSLMNQEKARRQASQQAVQKSIEQAARNNKAREIRRKRAADRAAGIEEAAEEATADSVEQAERDNEARRKWRDREEDRAERARRDSVDKATRDNKARRLRRERRAARTPPMLVPPVLEEAEAPQPGLISKALQNFTPQKFFANMLTATGWLAGVQTMFKTVELVNHSMERMIEIGSMTARLGQIFKGVGGNAQELTQDVLGLASATGRSTEEAMEAAVAWSRFGFSRREVDEAVTVSLKAANVARLDAGQATRYLSSLTMNYGLQSRELDGVLGQLNNTANKYNVTVADLLEGMSRVAPIAKQAGMSLSELQGVIGAAVGRTGQTGTVIGNALKTVMVRLSQPDIQEQLRSIGVETLSKEPGKMKDMSELLREIFVRYQSLNEEERKNLMVRIAGATQASRFVAFLESYVTAQRLAADGQLNLNSAQAENNKILATQRAQLTALGAAWDAFVVKQANSPSSMLGGRTWNQTLVTGERTLKNLVNVMNFRWGQTTPNETFDQQMDRMVDRRASGLQKFVTMGAHFLSGPMGAAEVFNNFMEGLQGQRNRQVDRLSQADLQARNAAEGHGRLAQLYGTVAAGLGGNQERNLELVRDLNSERQDELAQLVRANEIEKARALLLEEQAKETRIRQDEERESDRINSDAIAKLRAWKAEMITVRNKTPASGRDDIDQQLKEFDIMIAELQGRKRIIPSGYEGEFEDLLDPQAQRFVTYGERIKALIGEITTLWDQMPVETATNKMQAQLMVLREQDRLLTAQMETFFNPPGGTTPTSRAMWEQARQQREQVRGQISGIATKMDLVNLQDDRAIAFRMAGLESQSFGVGMVEAQKLLNREAALRAGLAGIDRRPNRDDNDNARGLVFQTDLLKTQQSIQERIVFLEGQRRQIIFDTNREIGKSLLFSNPGELMQKLFAMRMASNSHTSAAQFFAMDPESRRFFDMVRGGEAGRENRMESAMLAGRHLSVSDQQIFARDARARIGGRMNDLGVPRAATPVLDPLTQNAQHAASQVAALGAASAMAASQLLSLSQAVSNLGSRLNVASPTSGSRRNAAPATAAAPRAGINTGHALGDMPARGAVAGHTWHRQSPAEGGGIEFDEFPGMGLATNHAPSEQDYRDVWDAARENK